MEKTQDVAVPSLKITKAKRPQTSMNRTPRKIQMNEPSLTPSSRRMTPKTPTSDRSSYVGFKAVDRTPQSTIAHGRNMMSTKPMSQRAGMILQSLDQMISDIGVDKYPSLKPPEKLEILKQTIEAHNFAWNEVTLQVKEYSDEHATVFAKLKSFYNSLFDEYPRLCQDFTDEIDRLMRIIRQKDQHIEALAEQMEQVEDRANAAKNMIYGLQKKLDHVIERKKFFKNELEIEIMKNEHVRDQATDLRCLLAKQGDGMKLLEQAQQIVAAAQAEPAPAPEPEPEPAEPPVEKPEYVDVGVNTTREVKERGKPAKLNSVVRRVMNSRLDLTASRSEDAFQLPPIQEQVISTEQAPLRHVIYELMQTPAEQADGHLEVDISAQVRRFNWVYPKVMAIYVGASQFQNKDNFKLFEDVITAYMMEFYHTTHTVTQMAASLIQSAEILEKVDPAMSLFGMFFKGKYDIRQFFFFNALIEFAMPDITPSLATLMESETLTQNDTQLTIDLRRAKEIYFTIFPFEGAPSDLNNSEGTTNFWEFVHICIQRFDTCRKHMWAIVKAGFCLSDCPDTSTILYSTFNLFCGVVFSDMSPSETKKHWKDLVMRRQANEQRGDVLDFESVTYFITEHEERFFEVMNTKLAKNFTRLYYDLSAPLLKCIAFIVKRLIYYVPELKRVVPDVERMLSKQASAIRKSLFMCNISEAFGHYQVLLHLIDGVVVRDFTRTRIAKDSSDLDVKNYLQHFLDKEKVVGIFEADKCL